MLEELVWKADSPLWDALAQRNEPIPSGEEVFLPSQIEKTGDGGSDSQPKRYAVIKSMIDQILIFLLPSIILTLLYL